MIDINELRRLTQSALAGPDGTSLNWIKLLQDFQQKVSPAAVSELLDRLEAAEFEALEEARLNGMGSEREAALMAKLEAAENDAAHQKALADSALRVAEGWEEKCRALRAEVAHVKEVEFHRKAQAVADGWRGKCERLEAKIAEMEQREPVATVIKEGDSRYWMSERLWTFPDGKYPLYALPGAKGEEE